MRIARIAGIAALLALAAPAAADDLSKLCDRARKVEVGQWAEYQMTGQKEGESGRMRLAIVGSKEVAGKPAYWIEIKMQSDAGAVITQVLAGGYPYDTSQIHEMVVKAGDQPAMTMPSQAVSMMRNRVAETPSFGAVEKCEESQVVGWEKITVPAGEFRALHVKPADAKMDAWALEEIPFGLLRSRGAEGQIVLLGYGKDAKSSIREKPLAIPGMGGF